MLKIHVFAILKDYYKESFQVENSQIRTVHDLRNALIKINPAAAQVLNSCRFALNQEFVNDNFQLKENDEIYILPPSSGG